MHESILKFNGKAIVFDSENDGAEAIVSGAVKPGHVMVIRYEGPRGGPGMQEMVKLTILLKAHGLDKVCALVTDGRFSGATSGLSVGHMSPEAASGGAIALVRDGDAIEIDIPARRIHLRIDDAELDEHRQAEMRRGHAAWKPKPRERRVSTALKAYALLATSADRGAVRDLSAYER